MKTKIATTFGLALMLALGILATMLVLGSFSLVPSKVKADVNAVTFTPSDTDVNDGASWIVTFTTTVGVLAGGADTITIVFPAGVVLPDTIDKARIRVGPAGGPSYPLLSDPAVSGSEVILTVPALTPAGDPPVPVLTARAMEVLFDLAVGILNPPGPGAAGGATVSTSDETEAGHAADVTFDGVIDVPGSAAEGAAVTVTVEGLTSGQGVTLTGAVIGSGTVGTDQIAVIVGTMGGVEGRVTATDGAGVSFISSTITVKPSLTATATGKVQDTITLTGKNFKYADPGPSMTHAVTGADSIKFGVTPLNILNLVNAATFPREHVDSDGDNLFDDFSIDIKIPSGTSAGVNRITLVTSQGESVTANVYVKERVVTLDPNFGPPGTVVTVHGSNLPANSASVPRNQITLSIGGPATTTTNLFTDGNGDLPGQDTITIPLTAKSGNITVTVSIIGGDGLPTTGTANFSVGDRGVTATPNSGPKGTEIALNGEGFRPGGTITDLTIDGHDALPTGLDITINSDGSLPATPIKIPAASALGNVTLSVTDSAGLVGTTTLDVTKPEIQLSADTGNMGDTVTISGTGWVPGTSITITGTNTSVAPPVIHVTAVATSLGDGTFRIDVVIPSTLGVGTQSLFFSAADPATFRNTSLAVKFTTAGAEITLSQTTATVGDTVTVTGTGFVPNSALTTLTVAGANVLPPGAPVVTGPTGGLTVSFLVPGLIGSNKTVAATVGLPPATTTSLTIEAAAGVTPPPMVVAEPGPPVEVFSMAITADPGLQVWGAPTGTFQLFDASLPADHPANDLTLVGPTDGVWINNTTGATITVIILGRTFVLNPDWNFKGL